MCYYTYHIYYTYNTYYTQGGLALRVRTAAPLKLRRLLTVDVERARRLVLVLRCAVMRRGRRVHMLSSTSRPDGVHVCTSPVPLRRLAAAERARGGPAAAGAEAGGEAAPGGYRARAGHGLAELHVAALLHELERELQAALQDRPAKSHR